MVKFHIKYSNGHDKKKTLAQDWLKLINKVLLIQSCGFLLWIHKKSYTALTFCKKATMYDITILKGTNEHLKFSSPSPLFLKESVHSNCFSLYRQKRYDYVKYHIFLLLYSENSYLHNSLQVFSIILLSINLKTFLVFIYLLLHWYVEM